MQVSPEWTVPAGPHERRVRPWTVVVGIVLALLGHVPTGWLTLFLLDNLLSSFLEGGSFLLVIVPVVQLPLLVACATGGGLMLRYGDRGLGIGLLSGWVAGAAATFVIGLLTATNWWDNF